MILVGQYDSPFVRRVAITLHYYDIPFERDPKSIFADAEAVRRLNPLGRVPVLVLDDGQVLVDSAAILLYLDELAGPERALIPSVGRGRRDILQAMTLSAGISEKVAALFFERRHHAPAERSKEWEDDCVGKITSALRALETASQAPWFFGNVMTHADITFASTLSHLRLRFPELFTIDAYPKLYALSELCEAQEVFRAARPSDDETVPTARHRFHP